MAEEENQGAQVCYSALHVGEQSWRNVFEKVKARNFEVNDYNLLVEGDNGSRVYCFSNVLLDASDVRSENVHTQDSAALLLVMLLIFLTVITIWVFKVKRFRIMHETGLAMVYGKLVPRYQAL